MNAGTLIPLFFVIAMVTVTVWLGIWSTKRSRTAADFFVASRSVGVGMNAAAISGEYLSAASFMGVAGLVMKFGYDPLWYPACYAAGYLLLLLFVAGPLRRFGAYTIPDFAEGRFDSPGFRKVAVTFVLFIGFFYTMPQMKGAGVTMMQIMGWPYAVGIAVVGAVITFNVAVGGMKGITLVQAFQYWAKLFAISAPLFVLMTVFGGYKQKMAAADSAPKAGVTFGRDTKVKVPGADKAPLNALTFSGSTSFPLPAGGSFKSNKVVAWDQKNTRYLVLEDRNFPDAVMFFEKGTVIVASQNCTLLATGTQATPLKAPVKFEFQKPVELQFTADQNVPNAPSNEKWIAPFGAFTSKNGYPLLYTYSLIIALVCGTAGLPHILVRFYTNPDGRAARRTTFWVMVLIGVFYMFTPIWGALGRSVVPHLYATGKTDAVVIDLPKALDNQLVGAILTGITSAGAFAAFMSTFSGLLVSMSGALAHDIYGRMLRPDSSPGERLVAFKIAAIVFGSISMALGYFVEGFDIAKMVGWAFAIAAASYFPLLLLGSWWRGLTKWGAAIGMLAGGLLSLIAIVSSMLIDKGYFLKWGLPVPKSGIILTLIDQPAIWGVPLALFTMFIVSSLTADDIPEDVDLKMLLLHVPEELGFSKNYIEH